MRQFDHIDLERVKQGERARGKAREGGQVSLEKGTAEKNANSQKIFTVEKKKVHSLTSRQHKKKRIEFYKERRK